MTLLQAGCSEGCELNASYILSTMSRVIATNMGENGYLRQGGVASAFSQPFYTKTIDLPRQARDDHRNIMRKKEASVVCRRRD